jgi:hypothetical protein
MSVVDLVLPVPLRPIRLRLRGAERSRDQLSGEHAAVSAVSAGKWSSMFAAMNPIAALRLLSVAILLLLRLIPYSLLLRTAHGVPTAALQARAP